VKPFAKPENAAALVALRRLADTFRSVNGRMPTQEELDVAIDRAGLPYRISVELLSGDRGFA
jgi:hypothetical protein